eukprot:2826864-Rhodomonas_salina.4
MPVTHPLANPFPLSTPRPSPPASFFPPSLSRLSRPPSQDLSGLHTPSRFRIQIPNPDSEPDTATHPLRGVGSGSAWGCFSIRAYDTMLRAIRHARLVAAEPKSVPDIA